MSEPFKPLRIVLADDPATVRQGLRLLIDGQPDLTVVGPDRPVFATFEFKDMKHGDEARTLAAPRSWLRVLQMQMDKPSE